MNRFPKNYILNLNFSFLINYIFIFILFFAFQCYAHQPKLIKDSPTKQNAYFVSNPEISKAFYGQLKGEPHFFKIISDKNFLFYAGILTPKTNNENIWVSIEVIHNDEVVFFADGKNFKWEPWYEPYARDYYWKGPEIGKDSQKEFKTSFPISKGTYYIKVFNENNKGHYSLAVGEAEFFGANLWEQTLTWTPILFYIGPYMDFVHWKKFDIKAFIPHIVVFVFCFIIYFIFRKFFSRTKKI